jgi:transcriptional regulator
MENESTNQLLRVIIALLVEQSESLSTLKQKVLFLDRAGLGQTEIGRVLGRTRTHIGKELAGLRKAKKKR